jgi:hypothetical protein
LRFGKNPDLKRRMKIDKNKNFHVLGRTNAAHEATTSGSAPDIARTKRDIGPSLCACGILFATFCVRFAETHL